MYRTRPIEGKRRARELRLQHYRDIWNAREEGKLLVMGGMRVPFELVAGFGDFECLNEHYSITVGTRPELAQRYAEAFESRGFARDFCALSRLYLGSMFAGESPFGPFPRPDFCFMYHACDIQGKWFQVVSEHFGVPYFCIEQPVTYPPEEARRRRNIKYLAEQFYDFIQWGERVLGRKFDDERFLKATYNSLECQSLWGEICCMNKAVPAPLDERALYALTAVACIMRHKDEAVAFYRELRDEIAYRRDEGIAAVAGERYRMMHDNQPPYYFLELYQIAERYGVVCIGSHTSFYLIGAFETGPDGRLRGRRTPREQGVEFRSREDIVEFLARWYEDMPFYQDIMVPELRLHNTLRLVEEWGVNGVLIHINRGCEGVTSAALLIRNALKERGIPTAIYEANYVDRRDFSQSQVVDILESFLESQGLTPLEGR